MVKLWDYIKSKFSLSTTGSGNAVTGVSYSNGAFTVTKGSSFVPTTRTVNSKALSDDIVLTGADLFANAASNYRVSDFLDVIKVSIYDGTAASHASGDSYACIIHHIVSLHIYVRTTKEITVDSETDIAQLAVIPYGDRYDFYPLVLGFYNGTPIAGIQCYVRGADRRLYVKPLQNAIPSGTGLYINGTFLTESNFPDLPT